MNLMNEHDQVVTQDFAKSFVDHRNVGLRAQIVTKFALHHTEGALNVAPLVVVRQKVLPSVDKVVIHLRPCFDLARPSLLKSLRCST